MNAKPRPLPEAGDFQARGGGVWNAADSVERAGGITCLYGKRLVPWRRRGTDAFTLTQVLVASVIFSFLVVALVSSNFFGLKVLEVTQTKLGANDYTKRVLGRLTADIQAARLVSVGEGGLSSMVPAAINTLQQGNAVHLNSTTNTNQFIRYFWDATDQSLKRVTNGSTVSETIATAISNRLVFSAESFRGEVLTNPQNNFVVGVDLQFYELPNPRSTMDASSHFNSYRVRTRIARRATD